MKSSYFILRERGETLRKFIAVLLLIISMFSFFILYNGQKELQIYNMKNVEHHSQNSYEINIPNQINSLPRGTQLQGLLETSNNNDASMYFSRIRNVNGQEKIVKYYFSTNEEYMQHFQLVWGKKLDKTLMDTDYFLSTDETGDKNQIGRIASFDGVHMEIHTLQGMLDSGLFLDGPCTVTLPDLKNIDSLSNQFLKWLNVSLIDVTPSYDIGSIEPNKSMLQISVLFLVIMLLVLYDVLKSYKSIAIEKMLGYSIFHIWKKRISKIILTQIVTILISITIMSLIFFKELNITYLSFLKDLAVMYGVIILIILVIASIPFIYIPNIQISAAIKNKKPIKEIIFFNTIIKIMLCLGLLVCSQIILPVLYSQM
jgi:putative ABC transport system permease protein